MKRVNLKQDYNSWGCANWVHSNIECPIRNHVPFHKGRGIHTIFLLEAFSRVGLRTYDI